MPTKWTIMAASAAALLAAAPAVAAPVGVAPGGEPQGRVLILIPLTLTKVQDLNFGAVIADPVNPVDVTIDPTTGARTASDASLLLSTEVGQRGEFAGAGSPGQQVIMALTPATTLDDGLGNSLTVVSMALDGPNTRTVDPISRAFYVGVGGVIQVPANAPEGTYSSTYDLTADYQ